MSPDVRGAWTLTRRPDGVAVLTIDVPERAVNVLAPEVVDELVEKIALLEREPPVAVVIASGRPRMFIAGADVSLMADLRDPALVRREVERGQRALARLAGLKMPVIAAIGGAALGGGCELALAARARLAADDDAVQIGLPETRLGILPAWGGCQRLPQVVGLSRALGMILGARTLDRRQARRAGLIDEIVPAASLIEIACRRAAAMAEGAWQPRRPRRGIVQWALDRTPPGRAIALESSRRSVIKETRGRYPAPLAALAAVAAGARGEDGYAVEAAKAAELFAGDVAHHLIDLFLAREGTKLPRAHAEMAQPIERVAVIGAGVMGAGIAQVAAYGGLEVRLSDVDLERVGAGTRAAWRTFAGAIERRKLERNDARRRMERIVPVVGTASLGRVDLAIEAVVERLEVKQSVFAALEARLPRGRVLATNTSSLRVTDIARSLADPSRVVGLHFFNPVHRMPLVEVVRAAASSPAAVATAVAFVRRIGKTPIVVADTPGFLVNRVLMPYLAEAMCLVDAGVSVAAIDAAAELFGMPMGPLRLLDEIGLDVAHAVAGILASGAGERAARPEILTRLVAEGCTGRKGGKGFYDYGRATPRPRLGGAAPTPGTQDLEDRLILPMVNEAMRALDEDRVVASAAELDLAMVLGTGFPPFRGGLLAYGDTLGAAEVVRRLGALGRDPRFQPCPSLASRAAAGRRLKESVRAPS